MFFSPQRRRDFFPFSFRRGGQGGEVHIPHCKLIILLALAPLLAAAQQKVILVFDMENHTVDSIKGFIEDSTKISARTRFYRGTTDTLTELLEQTPPTQNLFPNSQYTRKRRAALDLDINRFPVRTSVKISWMKNDTLKSDCSGSLVSPHFVLSAAHCVSPPYTDSLFLDSLYVCPVFDNGLPNPQFPCSWVKKVYIFKHWHITSDDFSLLELKDPVGIYTGWISIGFDAIDSSLLEGIFYKFSYPAEYYPFLDSTHYNGDTLYYGYGIADKAGPNYIMILHTNGIPGESGSSLIKVVNYEQYTTYGVASLSTNMYHGRITNTIFSALEPILHDDLLYGIPEPEPQRGLALFPNPAADKVTLLTTGNREIRGVSITDIFGRTLVTQNAPFTNIDVSALPPGIYTVRARISTGEVVCKLVVNARY
jgi:hypothetical protein